MIYTGNYVESGGVVNDTLRSLCRATSEASTLWSLSIPRHILHCLLDAGERARGVAALFVIINMLTLNLI